MEEQLFLTISLLADHRSSFTRSDVYLDKRILLDILERFLTYAQCYVPWVTKVVNSAAAVPTVSFPT